MPAARYGQIPGDSNTPAPGTGNGVRVGALGGTVKGEGSKEDDCESATVKPGSPGVIGGHIFRFTSQVIETRTPLGQPTVLRRSADSIPPKRSQAPLTQCFGASWHRARTGPSFPAPRRPGHVWSRPRAAPSERRLPAWIVAPIQGHRAVHPDCRAHGRASTCWVPGPSVPRRTG